MYNTSSVCSVNHPARALAAQKGCQEKHRFIVGTCSLHESNELSVHQYYEDSNHFETVGVYSHSDQIWALETSPNDSSLVVTSHQNPSSFKALTLYRMPKQSTEDLLEDDAGILHDRMDLQELFTFNQSQQFPFVSMIRWHKTNNELLTIDQKRLSHWCIREDGNKIEQMNAMILGFDGSSETSKAMKALPGSVTWDPHTPSTCAVAHDSNIQLISLKDMEVTQTIPDAHKGGIRDLDYNPNKPYTFISAGEDRLMKIWDSRKCDQPLLTLSGHTHWVWTVRYNPYHDQLILSGGSDNMVNLWRIASCSSSPWIGSGSGGGSSGREHSHEEEDEENNDDPPDVKVRAMDQHEDSVYSVAWSPADAWIYCSLSYDGRIVVNHVPSTEKYKILL